MPYPVPHRHSTLHTDLTRGPVYLEAEERLVFRICMNADGIGTVAWDGTDAGGLSYLSRSQRPS